MVDPLILERKVRASWPYEPCSGISCFCLNLDVKMLKWLIFLWNIMHKICYVKLSGFILFQKAMCKWYSDLQKSTSPPGSWIHRWWCLHKTNCCKGRWYRGGQLPKKALLLSNHIISSVFLLFIRHFTLILEFYFWDFERGKGAKSNFVLFMMTMMGMMCTK